MPENAITALDFEALDDSRQAQRADRREIIEDPMMNQKSIAEILNDLLQILKQSKEGFRRAAEAAKDPEFKALFLQCAAKRAEMAEELLRHMRPERSERKVATKGAYQNGFDLNTALTSGDDFTILAECERGENRAIAMFKNALEQDLPSDLCRKIKSQSLRVLETHDKIKELRDTAQPVL
jgi:uncharacterized protein (TIGR02284 family)